MWWDPALLRLGVQPSNGLAQTRILEEDDAGRAKQALADWETWRDTRTDTVARGEKPSTVVRTATEWARAATEIPGSESVTLIDARWQGERPSGPRFGALVHATLATVDLDGNPDHIAARTKICARLFGAGDSEQQAAVEVVTAALGHPMLRRAAAAARRGECRRESSVIVKLKDGTLIESVADLAFRECDRWIVVDFKTDTELKGRDEVYRGQVALYVLGISDSTGTPTQGHLLRI